MEKFINKLLIILLLVFLIYSCGSYSENKCKDVNCDDEWISCNPENGQCDKLKDDFCIEDSDCKIDKEEYCNQDNHRCELPRFDVRDSVIVDRTTNLMWQNKNIEHKERAAAITHCEELSFLNYDDWRLEKRVILGEFHRETNKLGIVPKQMFDSCLAEVATDNYVKTKKGAEQYGGNPGDQFNFSGPANVRCVRDNKD